LFDLEDEVTSKRKEMKNATLSKAEERRTSEEDVEVEKRCRSRSRCINRNRRKEVDRSRGKVDCGSMWKKRSCRQEKGRETSKNRWG
jgi:hypothetical protein